METIFLILDVYTYTFFFGVCVVRKARKLRANSKSFPRRMWCRPMVQASACLQIPVSTSSECEAIYATIAARQREALKNLANTKAKAPFSCGTFCVGNRGAGWVIMGRMEILRILRWFGLICIYIYTHTIYYGIIFDTCSDFMLGDVGWKKTSDFASL